MNLTVRVLLSFLIMTTALIWEAPAAKAKAYKAPHFAEKDIQGQMHDLKSYEGKPVVLYFWASWCPGCMQDLGNVKKLHSEYQAKGVQWISVSLDLKKDRLEEAVKKFKIPYPVLFDGKGWKNKIAQLYEVNSTPTYFLIDSDGDLAGHGSWAAVLKRKLKNLS